MNLSALYATEDASIKALCRPSTAGKKVPATSERMNDEWSDGAPGHISPATLALDLRTYKHAKCGKCLHRGLNVKPQHNSRGEYRILGTCPTCLHCEEF